MPRTTLYGTFILEFDQQDEPIVKDLSYRTERINQLVYGKVKGAIKSWIQKAVDLTDK